MSVSAGIWPKYESALIWSGVIDMSQLLLHHVASAVSAATSALYLSITALNVAPSPDGTVPTAATAAVNSALDT